MVTKSEINYQDKMKRVETVRKLAKQGKSKNEICEIMNMAHSTLKNWEYLYDIEIINLIEQQSERKRIALQIWEKTRSYSDIAKALGISEKSALHKVRDLINKGETQVREKETYVVEKKQDLPNTIDNIRQNRINALPDWMKRHMGKSEDLE